MEINSLINLHKLKMKICQLSLVSLVSPKTCHSIEKKVISSIRFSKSTVLIKLIALDRGPVALVKYRYTVW